MTQALDLNKDDRVLEVGTGSGYQAAVLSQIVFRVYTVERIYSLFAKARKLFDNLRYYNIVTQYSDGTTGWSDESPFDAIIVTAGAPDIPKVLINQLAVGGRMVIPVGDQHVQELVKIVKKRGNDSPVKPGRMQICKTGRRARLAGTLKKRICCWQTVPRIGLKNGLEGMSVG